MNVTSNADSERIKIYIDGILHLRIPVDINTKIQSWREESSGLYVIEIWCIRHTERLEYEERQLWIKILAILDKLL